MCGPPEEVMSVFKAYPSRALNRLEWRHESTRRLLRDQDVREAIRQVVEQQGEPRAVFLGEVF